MNRAQPEPLRPGGKSPQPLFIPEFLFPHVRRLYESGRPRRHGLVIAKLVIGAAVLGPIGCKKSAPTIAATAASSPKPAAPPPEDLRARNKRILANVASAVELDEKVRHDILFSAMQQRAKRLLESDHKCKPADPGDLLADIETVELDESDDEKVICTSRPPWCPSAQALQKDFDAKKFRDEFDEQQAKKELEKNVQAAMDDCKKTVLAGTAKPLPALALVDVSLQRGDSDYDFKASGYWLQQPSSSRGDQFVGVPLDDTTFVLGQDEFALKNHCSTTEAGRTLVLDEVGAADLRVTVATDKSWKVLLPVAETEGRQMEARLAESPSQAGGKPGSAPKRGLRMTVAFEPTQFGASKYACTTGVNFKGSKIAMGTSARYAIQGRAVGYRIVDDKGALTEWQPFTLQGSRASVEAAEAKKADELLDDLLKDDSAPSPSGPGSTAKP